jgi:hypothetical protein
VPFFFFFFFFFVSKQYIKAFCLFIHSYFLLSFRTPALKKKLKKNKNLINLTVYKERNNKKSVKLGGLWPYQIKSGGLNTGPRSTLKVKAIILRTWP